MLASKVRSLAIIVWGAAVVLIVLSWGFALALSSALQRPARLAWIVFEWAVTVAVLGFVAVVFFKAFYQWMAG